MSDLAQPTSAAGKPITIWAIAPSAYLPALVYEIGNGAIAPIIALVALRLGASVTAAGLMLALLGIGQVLGDVPASSLAGRLGDRHAMMLASGGAVLMQLVCLLTPSLVLFGLALMAIGMCNSTYYLARQSYLTEVAPITLRARAISTLGGAHRIGLFLGPFVGALAIGIGGLRAPFVVAMIAASAASICLLVIADLETSHPRRTPGKATTSTRQMLRNHWGLFTSLGFAVLAVGAVRAARQTVLPLWADHIGLDAATTSLVFGVASAVDMALFYPAGKVMDLFGRLAVAIPAMTILGGAMIALPLTHAVWSITLVAVIMSFGNGIGSGIIQTIGADVSPAVDRLRFLSIWRVMSDTGNAVGPVVVSVVAGVASLGAGIAAVGGVGLLAAGGLGRWLPRFSDLATRRQLRRAHAQDDARAAAGPRPQ